MDGISLHRPFKARESTGASSRKYKAAIRAYMESQGYAEVTDSDTEGHLADMIFVPMDERLDQRKVWVESKATSLSASDPSFVKEIRQYVREYLKRTPDSRFHFHAFAQHLKNPTRWEEIFGGKVTEATLRAWLEPDQSEASEVNPFQEFPDRAADIVNFFVDSPFTEITKPELEDLVEARKKLGVAVKGARERARKFLDLLEERSKPQWQNSVLYGNYLEFDPPKQYDLLEVEPRSEGWLQEHLPRAAPPWVLLEKGKVLTIAAESSEAEFRAVNATRIDTLDLETLMEAHGHKIHELHCEILYRVAQRGIIRTHPRATYFNAYTDISKHRPRKILADGGELTVATPYYRQRSKPDVTEEIEWSSMKDPGKDGELRYVYHEGFHIDCVNMWGRFFARIHLQRCYSKDGYELLDGRSSAALDKKFRKPAYNRAETQLRKITMIGRYLFPQDIGLDAPEWRRKVRFKKFLNFQTPWTPESVKLRQTMFEINGHKGSEE